MRPRVKVTTEGLEKKRHRYVLDEACLAIRQGCDCKNEAQKAQHAEKAFSQTDVGLIQ